MSNLTTEHSAGQVTRNCAVASRGLRVYSSWLYIYSKEHDMGLENQIADKVGRYLFMWNI